MRHLKLNNDLAMIFKCFYISLLQCVMLSINSFAQGASVHSLTTGEPVSDALVIQNNNVIGYTENNGTCTLKNLDSKSKACIKAFGFMDTCLYIDKNDSIIFLRPISFETTEVQVEETALSPYEQLMKFLYYSLSLCNQEKETRAYNYEVTVFPNDIDGYEKMEGRFVYEERSSRKKRTSHTLYQCNAERTVTDNVYRDSVIQNKLTNSAKLPVVMWYLNDMNKPSIDTWAQRLKDKHIHKEFNDSTGYLFIFYDKYGETNQVIWRFDLNGRLLEEEVIDLHERNKFGGKNRGNWYTHLRYTKTGTLKVEYGVRTTIAPDNYWNQTVITLTDNMECDTQLKIPLVISIKGWAYIHKLPVTVVNE